MEEHGAQAHGGTIHEDEFLRHRHGSPLLQGLMDLEGLPPTVLPGFTPSATVRVRSSSSGP